MRVRIEKSTAHGTLQAPPSKSMAHRLLLAAALCEGVSRVHGIADSQDVAATIDCLRALGADITIADGIATVRGCSPTHFCPGATLPCRESGSTLRFLIPIALLSEQETVFIGAERLFARPLSVYEQIASEQGLLFERDNCRLRVRGQLQAGAYSVAGNISSQFLTGLLYALPLLPEDSRISVTTAVESRPYIDMTLRALTAFGIKAAWEDEHTLVIPGGQSYAPHEVWVEGDWSNAAFPDALNLFGSSVVVEGLDENSLQGDRVYRTYFAQLASGSPTLHIGNCPDLAPILFAVAAALHGGTFTGTARLRIKESDRAAAMAEELSVCGVTVTVKEDSVTVSPIGLHAPTRPLCGHNDHRIVMALSILLSLLGGEITGAQAVRKSYPTFFTDLKRLGIKLEIIPHEA